MLKIVCIAKENIPSTRLEWLMSFIKARSHRKNVAGAFLERWGEGAEF